MKKLMNLEELTDLENIWLSKKSGVSGESAYREMGVYDAWRMIFEQYVFLAREGDEEALKRALFLAWYEQAEPDWLTGVKDLDGRLIEEIFHRTNTFAEKDELDTELCWMLPWYYHVAPWYLDPFDDLEALKRISRGRWDAYRERCAESSFEGRGQLGLYWRSVQRKYA